MILFVPFVTFCEKEWEQKITKDTKNSKRGEGARKSEELVCIVCRLTLRVGSFDPGILPTQRVRLQKAKKSKKTKKSREFGAPFGTVRSSS